MNYFVDALEDLVGLPNRHWQNEAFGRGRPATALLDHLDLCGGQFLLHRVLDGWSRPAHHAPDARHLRDYRGPGATPRFEKGGRIDVCSGPG